MELDESSFRALGGPAFPGLIPGQHSVCSFPDVDGKLDDEPRSSEIDVSVRPLLNFLHLDPQVGFSTGQPVYDERGVAQRMLNFMENFFLTYPDLLDVPLFLVC